MYRYITIYRTFKQLVSHDIFGLLIMINEK